MRAKTAVYCEGGFISLIAYHGNYSSRYSGKFNSSRRISNRKLIKEVQKKKKTYSVRFLKKTTSPLLASVFICIWDWVMGFHSI